MTPTPARTTGAARWAGRALGTAGTALAVLLGLAGPAAAGAFDTLSAATAASLTLVGGTSTSGTATAAYDGARDQENVVDPTPLLAVDPTQPNVKTGVLVQKARAFADGTAAACAGIVGAGGSVSIGPTGNCAVTPGSGGVVVEVPGVLRVKASAITARCTAAADGTVTAVASLAGAAVYTLGVLGAETKLTDLAPAPAAGSGLDVLGLVRVGTNLRAVPAGSGSVRTSALELSVLAGVVSLKLGTVSCGPTKPTPALPVHGLPVAAGVLGAAGWAVFRQRGRLSAALGNPAPTRGGAA